MVESAPGRWIISLFFPHVNSQCDIQDLWKFCPNQMLWEAIRGSDAKVLSQHDVLQQLRQAPSVLIFPEPLPSLYLGVDPAYSIVPTAAIIEKSLHWISNSTEKGNCVLEIEPLYMISTDYLWMIVLTTENTQSGDQLCVLLHRVSQ